MLVIYDNRIDNCLFIHKIENVTKNISKWLHTLSELDFELFIVIDPNLFKGF